MRDAFRTKGFGRLFVGLTLSDLGDSIMLLVLSMWVKELTGSNGMAGLTFLFLLLPSLAAPVIGVWVDRLSRKRILVWGNAISAAALLPLLLVDTAEDVWIIWSVAVLYGIAFVVLPAARNAVIKDMLPEDDLVSANSSLQTAKEGYRLFGPLLGAGLYAGFGGGAVALVDAATFLAAGMVIATIPLQENIVGPEESDLRGQVMAGLAFLRGDGVLKHVLVGFVLTLLVLGFSESSIFALLDEFGKRPTDAALVVSIQGLGAVLGGLLATRVVRRFGEVATIAGGLVALGVPFGVAAATHSYTVILICAAGIGMSLPPVFVSFTTLVQKRTPSALMGRVSASIEVVLGLPQSLSIALGAALVVVVSYRVIWGAMCVVILLAAAYVALTARRGAERELTSPTRTAPAPSPSRPAP